MAYRLPKRRTFFIGGAMIAALLLLLNMMAACSGFGAQSSELEVSRGLVEQMPSTGPMAGVSGADESFGNANEDGRFADTTASVPPLEVEEESGGDGNQRRIVLKNATLTVKVADPEAQSVAISLMAEDMGGWVVTSNSYQTTLTSGEAVTNASVTVRVPAEHLNEALDIVKSDAIEVQSENISGQDVTQDYIDISSRLNNLEAAEEQLQEILDTARTAQDVLAVFNELTRIRGDIEVVRGRIQYYDEASSYSSLTVTLWPDVAASAQLQGWQPTNTVESAFVALVNVLQGAVDVAIFLVVFGLPLLLVVGIPLWLIIRTYRRRRRASTLPIES
ncbi:MAG: DUF4349 domain-containing protein [Burkholderiales bacterium]|nr:DUF4349 domain-containing protein [Anaerolineae bacterium]